MSELRPGKSVKQNRKKIIGLENCNKKLTEEGFLEKLRTAKPERGESFGQFMTRLEGYFNRWIELGHVDKTYQGLKDALLREQAMSVVTRNLRIFIMERKPKDIGDMGILAE